MLRAEDWFKDALTSIRWQRSSIPFSGVGQMQSLYVGDPETGYRAYMKPSKNNLSFPHYFCALERIDFCLAHVLAFPVPSVQLGYHPEILTLPVCFSLEMGSFTYKWERVQKDDPIGLQQRAFSAITAFLPIIAFDAWIYNTDRNNSGNIVVCESEEGNIKIYSIDYSHSMIDVPEWDTNPKYDVLPLNNVLAKTNSRTIFDSALNRIKEIDTSQIEEIVNSIPEPFLTDEQKEGIRNGLIYRRDNIREIFNSWWQIKQGR